MSEDNTAEGETSQSGDSEATLKKWWIESHGKPYGAAYIATMLATGRVKSTTLVCQVGNSTWESLGDCDELADAVNTQQRALLPSDSPATSQPTISGWGALQYLTNSELPWFANWVCVYCIVVCPARFALGLVMTYASPTASDLVYESPLVGYAVALDVIVLLAECGLTIALLAGGLSLRAKRPNAAMLVMLALALRLAWTVVEAMAVVLWGAIATIGEQSLPDPVEFSANDMLLLPIMLILLLGYLAVTVFDVVAMVWLFRWDYVQTTQLPN